MNVTSFQFTDSEVFSNTFFFTSQNFNHKNKGLFSTIKTKAFFRGKGDLIPTNPLHPQVIIFWDFSFSSNSESFCFFFPLMRGKLKQTYGHLKQKKVGQRLITCLSCIFFTATKLSVFLRVLQSKHTFTAAYKVKDVKQDILTVSVNTFCEVPSVLAL